MLYFKTAAINDTSSLTKLVNSAYRGDSSTVGWTTEAHLLDGQRTDEESLTAIIKTPHNQIEMAFDSLSHELIGCVHLKFEDEDTLYFGMLTVSPVAQSKGLGKEIIKQVESVALLKKCKRIRISVIQYRKELISFYERRGFVASGKFENFPTNDPKFGIPKVWDLELREYIKNLLP